MSGPYVITAGRPCAELCGHVHAVSDAESIDKAREIAESYRAAGHRAATVWRRDIDGRLRFTSAVDGPASGLCAPCATGYDPLRSCHACGQLAA